MTKVLVNFIQDRSGSMQSVWEETLNGFRAFIKELREKGEKDGVDYLVSLTTFDTLVEAPVIAEPIKNVDLNVLAKHGPRGSTALYDAVGATIQNTDANRHDADKIIVVVVTDGHENSSREWTKDRLHSAVNAKLNAGDWTFTYLGTQPETWDDAQALGLHRAAASSYDPLRTPAVYTALATSVLRMSSSPHRSTDDLLGLFTTPEERISAGIKKEPAKAEEKKEEETGSKPADKSHWR